MRHHNLQVTGSVSVNGISAATAADLATYTGSNDTKISTLQSFTASVGTTNTFTASASDRLNNLESFSSSVYTTNTFTSSASSRLNALETTSASVNTLNTTQNSRLDSLEAKTGSLATTGSNTFIGTQTITGSLYITTDLIVQGSSSLQNITASAVSIGTNIINLNTANPAIRYAGLSIGDSGSIGSSGSFLYDSVQDEFIFVHRGANTTVTSSVVLMGPQTYDNIGNETYLTTNRIPKGAGNEHLIDSNIADIGSSVGIGITNPTYPLTRNGMTFKASGTDGAEFVMLSSTDTGYTGGVLVRNGLDFGFINRTSGSIIFATNATERMFINSAGNVGIATASPTAILNVWGDGSTDIIKATRSSVTRFVVKNGTNTVGINTDTVNSALTVNGNVDMVGNVGINTTTAYSPLTLKSGNISWGETVTMYPSPSGYITMAFRLQGADSTTGTWAIGKQSNTSEATVEYLQVAKNGLTGGALHRADAVQTWDPANGNALFGFKVGIGTTSPATNFHISIPNVSNTKSEILRLTDGVTTDFKIYLDRGTTVNTSTSVVNTYAGNMSFETNNTERMRINSSGYVTQPYQPAFHAYTPNGGMSITGGSWYNVSNAMTVVSYNIGSNYSGGRFTAPVAGRYFFYAGGWSNIGSASNGERYAWCAIVNGGSQTFITGGNYCITDSPLSSYSVIHNLAAGDYVDLHAFSAVSGTWGAGTHRAFFGGYLL